MLQFLMTEFEGEPTWYVWRKTELDNITMDCLTFYGNFMRRINWQEVYYIMRDSRPRVVQDIPVAFKSQIFKALFEEDEHFWPLLKQMARSR